MAAHHGREALSALLGGRVRVLAALPLAVAFSLVAGVPEHFEYVSTTTLSRDTPSGVRVAA